MAAELREDADVCAEAYIVIRGLVDLASHDDDGTEWPCAVAEVPGPFVPFVGTPVVLGKASGMDV